MNIVANPTVKELFDQEYRIREVMEMIGDVLYGVDENHFFDGIGVYKRDGKVEVSLFVGECMGDKIFPSSQWQDIDKLKKAYRWEKLSIEHQERCIRWFFNECVDKLSKYYC